MSKLKAWIFFVILFLAFDSFGMADLTQLWTANPFRTPEIFRISNPLPEAKPEFKTHDSVSLSYKSWRQIQISA